MNKKRILTVLLALLIIGTASTTIYESRVISNSTKNNVITVNGDSDKSSSDQSIKGKISDEVAVKIAAKAMKDYMGLDATYFTDTKIIRVSAKNIKDLSINTMIIINNWSRKEEDSETIAENAKKYTDNLIYVQFTPRNKSVPGTNVVIIDEKTGEIVRVEAYNNLDITLKEKIDDNKVNEATLNFFKQIGKSINNSSILVDKDIENGTINVIGTLNDGRGVSIALNAKNYSIIDYNLNYNNLKTLPSEEKQQKEKFRELKL